MTRMLKQPVALVILALLAVVLVYAELADSRERVDETRRLMESEGRAIAAIVGESSLHGLQVFNLLEAEQKAHLLDNANWLAWVGTLRDLSDADLDKFAADLALWRILIYAADGTLVRASQPEGAPRRGPGRLPDSFLSPLLSGTQRSGILGGQEARRDGQSRLVAGVARPGGGAVVVISRSAEVERARTELSPGHLIQALGESHGLIYVALQDENGIIASSTEAVGFNLPAADTELVPLQEGADFVTRHFDSPLGPVLEVAQILPLSHAADNTRAVLLRVGLDARLLADMQADIQRRTLLRLLLTAISLGLIMAILMAWQRQRVLRREVRKISRELQLKEEETRRKEKLAAMGHLAAGVAHEIRNPLNTIHLIAQKLGRSPQMEDPLRLQADQIRDESRRIEGIVRQFLEFARPRDPVPVDLDLAEVVCATVAVHRSAHPEERLRISCDSPDRLPAHLDHDMVVEVVDNLVRNAIEAQPRGGAVRVRLLRDGTRARIHIDDEGPGIPEGDRARIFDLYFTTKPEGSGLGLSLVARMVSALGGHLELEETEPGAHFVVTLPLHRSTT